MVLTRFPIPLKSVTPLELLLFIVFVIYIVLPIQTPTVMAGYIDSPVGYLIMFVLAIYLFNYTTPLLGIVFLFVAHQLISRTAKVVGSSAEVPRGSSQEQKDRRMVQMNPPATLTLEEEVIAKMAPTTNITDEIPNADSFLPNAPQLTGASMF
jgi:hypothetical protein